MILQVSCDWCVCFARKPSEPLAMFSKAPVHLVVLGGLPASAWCPQSVWTERASASGFPTPSRIPREATVGIGFHIYPQEWSHGLLHSRLLPQEPYRSTAVRPHGLEAKPQVVPIRGMTQREAVSCVKALQLSCVASWHFTRLLPHQKDMPAPLRQRLLLGGRKNFGRIAQNYSCPGKYRGNDEILFDPVSHHGRFWGCPPCQ